MNEFEILSISGRGDGSIHVYISEDVVSDFGIKEEEIPEYLNLDAIAKEVREFCIKLIKRKEDE